MPVLKERNRRGGVVPHPRYLFSGLTRCGACGGGFILSSRDKLVCFNARERGISSNRRTIKRQEVEAPTLRAYNEVDLVLRSRHAGQVFSTLKGHLLSEAAAEFLKCALLEEQLPRPGSN